MECTTWGDPFFIFRDPCVGRVSRQFPSNVAVLQDLTYVCRKAARLIVRSSMLPQAKTNIDGCFTV